jgi:hypothetical protein
MNRRQMLIALAGVTGAAAVSERSWGVGKAGAPEAHEGDAYEPWRTWPHGSGLMLAASAAVLAASPHNTQPWKFHLRANRVDLFADAKRTIGAVDPLLREQQIGTGCALENLLVAAAKVGFGIEQMFLDPDPATERIASVTFREQTPQESVAYRAIAHRHTNRGPYLANRAIPAGLVKEMEQLNNTDRDSIQVILWTDPNHHERMRELIIAASEAIVADRQQSHDSAQWYRGTHSAINHYRDGITIDAQGLSPVMTAISKLMATPPQGLADRVFIDRTKHVHCGPGATFGTIVASAPAGKLNRVSIGRVWQRIHLWGTSNGLAMQPLNQIHERIDREATTTVDPVFTRDLAALVDQPNWNGLFSFRMGYAARAAKPSPRRDLDQFLI